MVYEYTCSLCEKVVEIECPMSEAGNLSPENKQKLKCPGFGKCEHITQQDEALVEKIEFNKVYTSIAFLKFDQLPNEEKQKVLKKRASADFKKNIEERKRVMQGSAVKQLRNL